MCEFISWIETADNKIYFLSKKQLPTKKGQALREFCQADSDLTGHGAIRRYYKLAEHDGANKECTDFSTPANFPDVIVKAIKDGDMAGFGVNPFGLLNTSAGKAYGEAIAPAFKAYHEAMASALKVYNEAKATTFWDLFANPENRNPLWN